VKKQKEEVTDRFAVMYFGIELREETRT